MKPAKPHSRNATLIRDDPTSSKGNLNEAGGRTCPEHFLGKPTQARDATLRVVHSNDHDTVALCSFGNQLFFLKAWPV